MESGAKINNEFITFRLDLQQGLLISGADGRVFAIFLIAAICC